jgi:hypothetical protein
MKEITMDVTLYAKAISNLLGNDVGFSLEGVDYSSFKINGNKDKPSENAIVEEVARLQAEQDATQYQRDREPEYPPVGDQLDAILKHLNYRRTQGEDLVKDLDNIVGAWLNVKSRYPKNGSN